MRGSRLVRGSLLCAVALGLLDPVSAAVVLYLTPDVPMTNPDDASEVFLPWDVLVYRSTTLPRYSRVVQLPAGTPLDALHKMDRPGAWLLSVDVPTWLPPDPADRRAVWFQPEDVFQYQDDVDPPTYSMFFDGALAGVPPGSDVDAVFLVGGDTGFLVLSFSAPTTIAGVTYEPADLVRHDPELGFSIYFDASSAGAGIAVATDLEGADRCGVSAAGLQEPVALSLDIPTDLAPSTGPATYVRGQVASWDGIAYGLFADLGVWPQSSVVRSISCEASPGRVYDPAVHPFAIRVERSMLSPANIVIRWAPSCASGAVDYFVYEGSLAALRTGYDHEKKACADAGHDLTEEITPQPVDSYYLVVPFNGTAEGSYGTNSAGAERPQAISPGDRCADARDTAPCPHGHAFAFPRSAPALSTPLDPSSARRFSAVTR